MPRNHPLFGLLLASLLLLGPGCGFQPRGTGGTASIPAGTSPIYIQGLSTNHRLRYELENRLYRADATTTMDPEQATSRLRISDRKGSRRVLAVDGNGKVLEYELIESARFELLDAAGTELLPPQQITTSQSFINADLLVLGKRQEEQDLREMLWQRMADQIIQRLTTQLRSDP